MWWGSGGKSESGDTVSGAHFGNADLELGVVAVERSGKIWNIFLG